MLRKYIALALATLAATPAGAVSFQTIFATMPNGVQLNRLGPIVVSPSGVVYGTTSLRRPRASIIFKLTPPAQGQTQWTFSEIYRLPLGSYENLALSYIGAHDALYGAGDGGARSEGTVFRLDAPYSGHPKWSFTPLHMFYGGYPVVPLAHDAQGNIYGTTYQGGTSNFGEVYQLTAAGQLNVLHSFNGTDGASPNGLLLTSSGLLVGTTGDGLGTKTVGHAFALTPSGSSWNFQSVHVFKGAGIDGQDPWSALVEINGVYYGTTGGDACATNCGTVFSLTPSNTGEWPVQTLYAFTGQDGAYPFNVAVTDKGGLIGGTYYGGGIGLHGWGIVYDLTQSGGTWTEKRLFRFKKLVDGASPALLAPGPNNSFFGTAKSTIFDRFAGEVFEITP